MRAKRQAPRTRRRSTARTQMSIEFLLVTFPEERAVLADGDKVGFTNHTLMLPANEYTITLDGDKADPASQDVVLAGTSVMRPKVVAFSPA
jgi:archaellum component FlaF (FlaF/FlaG flagellin family)